MPRWTYLLVSVAMMLACFRSMANAEQINDANLKFSVTIPDGFVRDPKLAAARPDFIYAFRRTEPQDMGVVIIIERMRGTIGREHLDMTKMPPGFAGKLLTVRWHDFDLDATEVPEEVNGAKTVNYNVQVPLKSEAIQIRVLGLADRKDQLLQLTNNLLGSLQGDSNWLRSSAPPALAQSSNYGMLIIAVMITGIVAGLIVLWLVRRVSYRGSVLSLAILIYAASWMIAPGETREMRATVGAVRLLGFLGILLGIFDVFRYPTAKRPAEERSAVEDRPGV